MKGEYINKTAVTHVEPNLMMVALWGYEERLAGEFAGHRVHNTTEILKVDFLHLEVVFSDQNAAWRCRMQRASQLQASTE
jgi:hypothetical protein